MLSLPPSYQPSPRLVFLTRMITFIRPSTTLLVKALLIRKHCLSLN